MAGFKQGGIEFKQKSVIGNPTTSDHIIVYWNNTNDLIIKTSTGEDVIATESLVAGISSSLQFQIDNLSGDFLGLTDTPSTYVGSDTYLLSVSGNKVIFKPESSLGDGFATDSELQTVSAGLQYQIDNLSGDFLGLTDTPITYTGFDSYVLTVSAGGIAFVPQGDISPDLSYANLSGALDPQYVNIDGDTMTGDLTISTLASISGNFLTVDATGTLVDSGYSFVSIGDGYATDTELQVVSAGLEVLINNNTTLINTVSGDLDTLETQTNGITGGLTQLDGRFVNVMGDTMTGDLTLNANAFVNGNITIDGNILQISGSNITQVAETLTIEDNLIVINKGETGAGVTLNQAGIEVDRGTEDNYLFLFDENIDNGTFSIGTSGGLQPVATRQETPTDQGIAYWNSSQSRFDTSSTLIGDIGNQTTLINTISGDLDVLETQVNGITGGLTQLDDLYVNVTGDTMTGNLTVIGEFQANEYHGLGLPINTLSATVPLSGGAVPLSTSQHVGTILIDTTIDDVDLTIINAISGNLGDTLKIIKTGGGIATVQTTSGQNIGSSAIQTIDTDDDDKGFTVMNNDGSYLIIQDNRFTSAINNLNGTYVNVTGDTMTGTLTVSGASINLPDLITSEENITQVDNSGDLVSTELQELYVPVEEITGPNATGVKGQWSYGLGYKYECIATNTWIKYAVVVSW